MKVNEWKWKKMKVNERQFPECSLFPRELGNRPGGSPFSLGEEQTFSECVSFPRKKESHPKKRPARGLRRNRFIELREYEREERRDMVKKKREDERENAEWERERWNKVKKLFSKNVWEPAKSARWISSTCFEKKKKTLSNELFLMFPSKVQNLTVFLNYLHDSNSIFEAAGN